MRSAFSLLYNTIVNHFPHKKSLPHCYISHHSNSFSVLNISRVIMQLEQMPLLLCCTFYHIVTTLALLQYYLIQILTQPFHHCCSLGLPCMQLLHLMFSTNFSIGVGTTTMSFIVTSDHYCCYSLLLLQHLIDIVHTQNTYKHRQMRLAYNCYHL